MIDVTELPDPEDSWARVELYRWQHGCLPNAPGHEEKPLDEALGLQMMAAAIERGDRRNFPTPGNVVSALRYAAKLIQQNQGAYDKAIDDALKATQNCLVEAPTYQQDELLSEVRTAITALKTKTP